MDKLVQRLDDVETAFRLDRSLKQTALQLGAKIGNDVKKELCSLCVDWAEMIA